MKLKHYEYFKSIVEALKKEKIEFEDISISDYTNFKIEIEMPNEKKEKEK